MTQVKTSCLKSKASVITIIVPSTSTVTTLTKCQPFDHIKRKTSQIKN